MLDELRTSYNDKLHGELDSIQEQKRKLSLIRKELRHTEKRAKCLEARNADIVEPFAKAKEDANWLSKEKVGFQVKKKVLEERKAELMAEESRLKDLQWRHEVMFQKFQLLGSEYANIQKVVGNKRLERQQHLQLNNMVLGNQVTELLELGRGHINVLTKLLQGVGSPRQHSSKVGESNKVPMEELKTVQSNMQHLHNIFMAEKHTKSLENPQTAVAAESFVK